MRRLVLSLLLLWPGATSAIRIQPTAAPPKPAASTTTPATPVPTTPAPVTPAPVTPAPRAYRPQDPLYPQQWNLASIRIEQAWQISRGSAVTVAVLDTGFAALPDLTGRVVSGYDFVSDVAVSGDGDGRDADARDGGETAYHASMVASLIASGHDTSGIAGVNPRARIVQVRVADIHGHVRVEDLVDAMRWSVGLGVPGVARNPFPARVLNLSLFADFIPLDRCDPRIQQALDEVTARGAVVVAGAGNDDADAAGYTPAGCRNVITVTATERGGRRAPYANWGLSVTLAAPGGSVAQPVLVFTPNGVARHTGTSLAAPLVSGVVSLMLGLNPGLRPDEVALLLQRSSAPFAGKSCDVSPAKSCGAGTLDAAKALEAARAFRRVP